MRMDDQPPIDGVIEVVTPENIMVHYRAAGPYRRVLAFAIDITLLWVAISLMWIAIGFVATSVGFAGGLGSGIGLVGMFLMQWGWFAVQEGLWNGRTLGKMATGLRVLTIDGQPIHWGQALIRGLLQAADIVPPITGYIVMSMNDRYQRLGDWAAGTIVIKEDRQWLMGVAKIDDPRAIQLAAYLPPDLEVSKTLAKALATYVERRRFFMATRRSEIARHLGAPLLRQFGLPPDTSHDLLLCAMYYRTFIGDHKDDERHAAAVALATQAVGTPAWGVYGGQPGLAYAPMQPGAPWNGAPAPVGMPPQGWPGQVNHPDGAGIVYVNPPGAGPATPPWSMPAPQQGSPR
jgi:uncharacterized RDD family membrane protein YckC